MNLEEHISFPELTEYLQRLQWLGAEEQVLKIEKPGEGNMNTVLRVVTSEGSLILKQANPFVQKYPSIPAPLGRIITEVEFYRRAESNARLQHFLPHLLDFDADSHLLAMEDLGANADYTHLYQANAVLKHQEALQLIDFLVVLHQIDFSEIDRNTFPDNLALRRLNHEHLFIFPYALVHGFDLDTVQVGLQELALPYKNKEDLKKAALALGDVYLGTGNCLLHGDFYPGSWLKVGGRLRVIDPEFSFFGPPEYDLGVMIAHLLLTPTPKSLISEMYSRYKAQLDLNDGLLAQFIGMEILRRLIGLAQLPLVLTLDQKAELLQSASALLRGETALSSIISVN
jgi:5-methylthioribose kinase